jgi:hypothetical protein
MDKSFDLEGHGDDPKTFEARINSSPRKENKDHQANFFDEHFAQESARFKRSTTEVRGSKLKAQEPQFDDSDDYYQKMADFDSN